MHIQLHHLFASHVAAVGEGGADDQLTVPIQLRRAQTRYVIGKRGVTQAMPECIQRRIRNLAPARFELGDARQLRAATARVVVEERLLPRRHREAHRQPSRRAVVTEQHIGHGRAGLRAQVPRHHDGLRVTHRALQRQRTAVAQQHHDRCSGGGHGFSQCLLCRRQREFHARLCLAGVTLRFAQRQHCDIGASCGGDCGFNAAFQWCFQLAARHDFQKRIVIQRGAHTTFQRDVTRLVAEQGPATFDVVAVLHERPDQRDLLPLLLQRQHRVIVLQQHDRTPRGIARQGIVFGDMRLIGLTRRVQRTVRIIEQTDGLLQLQDAAHRGIQHRHRHIARSHQAGQVTVVEAALHAQVQARHEGLAGGVHFVGSVTVRDQFHVGGVVGNHHAVELPLIAQQLGEQRAVGAGRHAVDVVEGAHHAQCAGFQRGLERRQVGVAQGLRRDIHLRVFHAGGHRAIGGEMLGRGQQRVFGLQVIALETAHAGHGEGSAQHHVLARPFGATAPTLVAGDIHRRCVGPMDAGSGRFDGRGTRGAAGQFRLEAGRFAQRDREHRAHAVDDIGRQDHRNAEAALFHRHLLDAPPSLRADAVEQRTHPPGTDLLQHLLGVVHIGFRVHVRRERANHVGEHPQLADLLVDGHPGDQRFDAV
ncbi:hypothetical protein D3C81_848590 [compost metagenome]